MPGCWLCAGRGEGVSPLLLIVAKGESALLFFSEGSFVSCMSIVTNKSKSEMESNGNKSVYNMCKNKALKTQSQ